MLWFALFQFFFAIIGRDLQGNRVQGNVLKRVWTSILLFWWPPTWNHFLLGSIKNVGAALAAEARAKEAAEFEKKGIEKARSTKRPYKSARALNKKYPPLPTRAEVTETLRHKDRFSTPVSQAEVDQPNEGSGYPDRPFDR